ncbi:Uncharacterised protein [Yersinia kristensenii]|nr:Uncharacterised protein [Yersinia kristensenii]
MCFLHTNSLTQSGYDQHHSAESENLNYLMRMVVTATV